MISALDVFSARDLRIHSGRLLQVAEDGRLSIITKHGKPSILAIPFDGPLLELGVNRDLALSLFENRQVSLAKAAKLAELSIEDFLALLSEAGIDAVDYPNDELTAEMDIPI
ncbi:MAG: UPF0175 family protein [Planctomycetota bacterium]|jgi:predicted HTH domain antitoxin